MSFEPQSMLTYRTASLVALWLETLLFGIHTVLFTICLYIFRGRRHSQNVVLIVTALLMFALSIAHLVTILITTFDSVLKPENGMAPEHVALASGHIYVTNNIIADGLIVYRCYMVWGSRKRIIILPSILLLTTAILGYTFRITIELVVLSLATSVTATGLTAARIWWIACQTKKHLGKQFARRYNTAFSIVVESGLIYSLSLLIFLVVYSRGPGSQSGPSKTRPGNYAPITTFPFYFPASYIVYAALVPIMGIVSTLIIVRVGLGLSTNGPASFSLPSTAQTAPRFGSANRASNFFDSTRPPAPVVSVELSTVFISTPSECDNCDAHSMASSDEGKSVAGSWGGRNGEASAQDKQEPTR